MENKLKHLPVNVFCGSATFKNGTCIIHHFPTCYAYSVKKPIGELNLERALDEDTGVFSFLFFFFCSTGPDSCFWEFHPSSGPNIK